MAITIDGTVDAEYGSPKIQQGVRTNFGNAIQGAPDFCLGSELDLGFAVIQGDVLYLLLAGNLESNWNNLEIFFDSGPGGQNRLRGDNPWITPNSGLNRMGELVGGNGSFGPDGPGLKFDDAFEPDYYINIRGGDKGGVYGFDASWAQLLTNGGGQSFYLGGGGAVTDSALSGGFNPFGIRATINNSNTFGVTGGCRGSSGLGVTTGMELAIPMAAIGRASNCILISAFINAWQHDFVSNQFLGSLFPEICNLGEPRFVDLTTHRARQYFEVCPAPVPAEQMTWGSLKAHYR